MALFAILNYIKIFLPTSSLPCIEMCEDECILLEIPPPKGKDSKQMYKRGYKYLVSLNHNALLIPWVCY